MPQNYLMIPLILKALPNARIVHLVRDPMDACFASFKQLFADAYLHSYEQREMARHHARYRKLMACWRERFPGRFLDISYEDTARDLEPNARALIEFLGLPWEDACLQFHEQTGAVTTASAVQVREPAHTRSIGRWRRYEAQLAPMQDELARANVSSIN
ncbi:sulfotransferase family protein [Halioglobus japonicus]|uniref:sulfotransferase family protein n=1 Tax=Halioglobus japonicus TaxID=930805 RepID=UPI0023E42CC1|nr:sulfotransferase [Halioglobus japonicus]